MRISDGLQCNHRLAAEVIRAGFIFIGPSPQTLRILGNKVILFAERPGFEEPDEPIELKSAQFEYSPESRRWTLYCFDRSNRRRPYQALPLGQDLSRLVAEVDADPTGAFWD